MSQLTWKIAEGDRAKCMAWAKEFGIPRLIAHLMTLRDIDSLSQAEQFLHPALETIADPFLMTDMEVAVKRLRVAREQNERVLVYGDYDVDGITGTALLVCAFQRFGIKQCRYALPSRFAGGYGLSPERVDQAHADGVTLIVTVDNGINARDEARRAQELGIDLIVTDHHRIEGDLPHALAIVNPVREVSPSPSEHASGVAVAFRLAWALTGEQHDLDIVALGTVADVVPLRGENRILVAAGLEAMRKSCRVGIQALASVARVELSEVTSENIAFQLGPRINAAGRLGDGSQALELLLTDSKTEAKKIAKKLNADNDKRREIERDIFEEAVEELDATLSHDQHSILLAQRHWHPGVIGIVAAHLAGHYNRPTVLICVDEDGVGRGSARSRPDFDLVAGLVTCAEHLERFGGHRAAAGMTVMEDSIPHFRKAFEAEAARCLSGKDRNETLDIDALVSLSEVDAELVRSLNHLQPFGQSNPAPVLCSCGVEPLAGSVRALQGGHLRLAVRQGDCVRNAIGFRMSEKFADNIGSNPIDIAYTPQFNTWRGETNVQLVLKDIRL